MIYSRVGTLQLNIILLDTIFSLNVKVALNFETNFGMNYYSYDKLLLQLLQKIDSWKLCSLFLILALYGQIEILLNIISNDKSVHYAGLSLNGLSNAHFWLHSHSITCI